MEKHYCDKCGKDIGFSDGVKVSIDMRQGCEPIREGWSVEYCNVCWLTVSAALKLPTDYQDDLAFDGKL